MNKRDVIREVINLSKRSDYVLRTNGSSYRKYSYNADTLDYITLEYGVYADDGGGWLKYYTKDVAKCYEMSSIEMILFENLFR